MEKKRRLVDALVCGERVLIHHETTNVNAVGVSSIFGCVSRGGAPQIGGRVEVRREGISRSRLKVAAGVWHGGDVPNTHVNKSV